jgi:hypothetical protein
VISAKDVPELEANLNLTQDPRLGIAGGINGMNQTLKKGRIKYTPF